MIDEATYDDFTKLHLVAGTIIKAGRMENSAKLLLLEISLGTETRQIIAGIGSKYAPDDLVGKQVIVVENLQPKKLMGELSAGMVLAGNDETGPVVIIPETPLPDGTSIH